MTEKIVRHGARVPADYVADFLDLLFVREFRSAEVASLRASEPVEEARRYIASNAAGARHQGFPVLDDAGDLVGVVTRRDLLAPSEARTVGELVSRPPVVVFESSTLREAADLMAREGIGRLPVVTHDAPRKVTGMLTRSDILGAHRRRIAAARRRT